jgi:hypothetical protein
MADFNKRTLQAAIAKLRGQQLADFSSATFFGWSPESAAAHDKRECRVAELVRQVASLDEKPLLEGE